MPWPRPRPADAAASARPSDAAVSDGAAGVPAGGTAGVASVEDPPGWGVDGALLGGAEQPAIQSTSPPPVSPEACRNARRESRRPPLPAPLGRRWPPVWSLGRFVLLRGGCPIMLAPPRTSGWPRAGPPRRCG